MFKKMFVFAIIAALVLAALPTTGVFASSGRKADLESKWEELNNILTTQSFQHTKVENMDKNWHKKIEGKTSTSDQGIYYRNMSKCDSAFMAAQNIAWLHAGFDKNGKVIDTGLASKSVKNLNWYLQQHAAALRQLNNFVY